MDLRNIDIPLRDVILYAGGTLTVLILLISLVLISEGLANYGEPKDPEPSVERPEKFI